MLKSLKGHHFGATLLYLIIFFSTKGLSLVVSMPSENSLLSRQNEWDAFLGQDSAPIDFMFASASQDNQFDGFPSDGCTFMLEGCPSPIDLNENAFDFGIPDEVGNGECDGTLGDCISLSDEWTAISDVNNLDFLMGDDGGLDIASGVTLAQDGSASEAHDAKDRQPRIYYDCDPNYTSCIIYDREKGPGFHLKANINCPTDVDFGGTALAVTSSSFRGSGLFGLPGWQCQFCLENGSSCEILDCDIASFPSKYNNWGQAWGTCQEQSCSCVNNNIKAFNSDVTTELAAWSDDLGTFL